MLVATRADVAAVSARLFGSCPPAFARSWFVSSRRPRTMATNRAGLSRAVDPCAAAAAARSFASCVKTTTETTGRETVVRSDRTAPWPPLVRAGGTRRPDDAPRSRTGTTASAAAADDGRYGRSARTFARNRTSGLESSVETARERRGRDRRSTGSRSDDEPHSAACGRRPFSDKPETNYRTTRAYRTPKTNYPNARPASF